MAYVNSILTEQGILQLGTDEFSFLTPFGIVQNDYSSAATPLEATSYVSMDGTIIQLEATGKSYLNMGGTIIQLLAALLAGGGGNPTSMHMLWAMRAGGRNYRNIRGRW